MASISPLSAADFNSAFGRDTTSLISLNDGNLREIAGIPEGRISYGNLVDKPLAAPLLDFGWSHEKIDIWIKTPKSVGDQTMTISLSPKLETFMQIGNGAKTYKQHSYSWYRGTAAIKPRDFEFTFESFWPFYVSADMILTIFNEQDKISRYAGKNALRYNEESYPIMSMWKELSTRGQLYGNISGRMIVKHKLTQQRSVADFKMTFKNTDG